MWNRILTEYAEVSAESEPLLWGQFYSCKFQQDQSVMNFISSIEQIAAQLNDVGAKVDDTQIVAKILVSLPPSFKSFVSAWDSTPRDQKPLSALTKRLVKEQKSNLRYNNGKMDPADTAFFSIQSIKHGTHNSIENQQSKSEPVQHAFPASGHSFFRGGRGRGSFRGRGDYRGKKSFHPYNHHVDSNTSTHQPTWQGGSQGSQIICHYCGLKGHIKRNCRNFKRDNNQNTNKVEEQSYSYKSSCFC